MLTSMDTSAWTVEDHLRDKPAAVVALYRRFVELVQACGPFDYAVSKTGITFKGSRRGFAGAKPKPTALTGTWTCSGAWRTRASAGLRPTPSAWWCTSSASARPSSWMRSSPAGFARPTRSARANTLYPGPSLTGSRRGAGTVELGKYLVGVLGPAE